MNEAWSVLGKCTGTLTPTTSPTETILAPWTLGGCPESFVSQTMYKEGDVVEENGKVYEVSYILLVCRVGRIFHSQTHLPLFSSHYSVRDSHIMDYVAKQGTSQVLVPITYSHGHLVVHALEHFSLLLLPPPYLFRYGRRLVVQRNMTMLLIVKSHMVLETLFRLMV